MTGKLRGVIISNCQAQPLRHALTLFCRGIEFDAFPVHILAPGQREDAIAAFIEDAKQAYSVILSIHLHAHFGPLSAGRLRETFPGKFVATIPNFHFDGLHPDLTYAGSLGQRLAGPVGEYHSKLAIHGYASGLGVDDTVKLFTGQTFEAMGFFAAYRKSMSEMQRREAGLDVPFARELEALLLEDLCFLTVNHPTSILFASYCGKLAAWLHERGIGERAAWMPHHAMLVNQLSSNAVFPVYPEIAEACCLPYPGNYLFKPVSEAGKPVHCLELEEFVAREHESFARVPRDEFLAAPQVAGVLRQALAIA